MNESEIKIGVTGKVLKGRNKDWYIFIEDDSENTGGFLLFEFKDFNKTNEGFDWWAEDKSVLLEMFKSAEWKILWLDEKKVITNLKRLVSGLTPKVKGDQRLS